MILKSRPTLILVLILLLLVGISVVWSARKPFNTSVSSVEAQTNPPAEGSLRWYAQQSAANGETQFALILSPRIPVATSLSDAIEDYGVVVGELLAQESVWYDPPDTIYTWYKFRLTETLKQKPFVACATCTFTPTPPASLLPLQSGEILVPLLGGSAMIDNVVVETNIDNFGGLVEGQNYLLFLNLDSVNQKGNFPIGPQGILVVNSDSTFSPVMMLATGETEPIISGLVTQYGNSLTNLRAALTPAPTPTPTPTCNSSQQQACLDDGGTWNSSNCTCTPAFDPCLKKPWLCE